MCKAGEPGGRGAGAGVREALPGREPTVYVERRPESEGRALRDFGGLCMSKRRLWLSADHRGLSSGR